MNTPTMLSRVARATTVLPWSIELSPWLYLWQLANTTDDGDTKVINAPRNCGPTSLAEIITYFYNPNTTKPLYLPDDIADDIFGGPKAGATNDTMLSDYLLNQWGLASTPIAPSQDLLWFEWEYTKRSLPVLELRYWRFPGDPYLHWVTVVGENASSVYVANPEPMQKNVSTDGSVTWLTVQNPTKDQLRQVETNAYHRSMTLFARGIDGFPS